MKPTAYLMEDPRAGFPYNLMEDPRAGFPYNLMEDPRAGFPYNLMEDPRAGFPYKMLQWDTKGWLGPWESTPLYTARQLQKAWAGMTATEIEQFIQETEK